MTLKGVQRKVEKRSKTKLKRSLLEITNMARKSVATMAQGENITFSALVQKLVNFKIKEIKKQHSLTKLNRYDYSVCMEHMALWDALKSFCSLPLTSHAPAFQLFPGVQRRKDAVEASRFTMFYVFFFSLRI